MHTAVFLRRPHRTCIKGTLSQSIEGRLSTAPLVSTLAAVSRREDRAAPIIAEERSDPDPDVCAQRLQEKKKSILCFIRDGEGLTSTVYLYNVNVALL